MSETIFDKEYIVSTKQDVERNKCGIYFLFDGNEVVYVGQSVNILARINVHLAQEKKAFDAFAFVEYPQDVLNEVEAAYIVKLCPRYNTGLPQNQTWANLETIHRKVNIRKDKLKKFIKNKRIEATNGFFHLSDFMELLSPEGI